MGQKKSRVTPARIPPPPTAEDTHITPQTAEDTNITPPTAEDTNITPPTAEDTNITPPPTAEDTNITPQTAESNANPTPSRVESAPHFSLSEELALELSEANNISQGELEFLWQQFNKYSLNEDNLIQCDTTEFSDPFTKNVFRRIQRVEDKPNNIEFASYVQYLSKWKNSNGLAKSHLLFQIIFNGDPISKILLTKLVSLVYPDLTQSGKEEKAEIIVGALDSKNSGVVDQEDFIEYFSRPDARAVINGGINLELTNSYNP